MGEGQYIAPVADKQSRRGPDSQYVLAHFLRTPSLRPGEHTTDNGRLLPSIARGAKLRTQAGYHPSFSGERG